MAAPDAYLAHFVQPVMCVLPPVWGEEVKPTEFEEVLETGNLRMFRKYLCYLIIFMTFQMVFYIGFKEVFLSWFVSFATGYTLVKFIDYGLFKETRVKFMFNSAVRQITIEKNYPL